MARAVRGTRRVEAGCAQRKVRLVHRRAKGRESALRRPAADVSEQHPAFGRREVATPRPDDPAGSSPSDPT